MDWTEAVETAENGGCEGCSNAEQCASTGACVTYLEDEIDREDS